mmetsp:Transcript_6913/g.10899  ORF Transcript_6913/g.10899 Transcript_6913/m.10899 type:complete len:312 (-) Transcript_6913:122-1057(-)
MQHHLHVAFFRSSRIIILLFLLFLFLLLLPAFTICCFLLSIRLVFFILFLFLLLRLILARATVLLRLLLHRRGGGGCFGSGGLGLAQVLVPLQELLRGLLVRPATLVQLALLDQVLLALGHWAQPPLPRVSVPLHHHPLDLGHHPVVASGHDGRGHLRDAHGDGLALGGQHHHLVPHLNVVREPQQPRDHELGPVADGVHRRVLHHQPLVPPQQDLQRLHHAPQVRLVLGVVVLPLGVQHVVHGVQVPVLVQGPGPDAAQLLHVAPHARHQAQVHAEGADVRARLTTDPENTKVSFWIILNQFGLVYGSNS